MTEWAETQNVAYKSCKEAERAEKFDSAQQIIMLESDKVEYGFEHGTPPSLLPKMQTFPSGATRSSAEGKPDYNGYLDPLVIREFGRYMLKHQIQADGQVRSSSNWKAGITKDAYMSSLWRHFEDLWLLHWGYGPVESPDADKHLVTKLEACMAILFNVMGYALEELKAHGENKR